MDDAEWCCGGPGAGERPVPDEHHVHRARRAVHRVDPHADLERRALARPERLARHRVADAIGHRKLRQGEPRLRPSEERVHAPALHGVEHGALGPLGHEEDGLHAPDALARRDVVERRLADGPRGAAPLAGRVLAEELVPAAAGQLEARRVLVDGPERRVAKGAHEVLGIRVRPPRDAQGTKPLLATVLDLRQRPDRHAGEFVDVVDERLMWDDAEVAIRGIGIFAEGPRARERERTHCAEDSARKPAPAANDDNGAANPLERPPLGRQKERARDQEEAGDEVERGPPREPAGGRVPRHRERLERRSREAEDEQVLLLVVHRHVERQRRARPVVVGHHLHAGNDEHARVARSRLGDTVEEARGATVEDGARLARDPRERAERRQPVLDAEEVVLAQQERADAGLLGLGGQLVAREITCRERGVHVEHRGQPLELRGARGGKTGEERHHDRGHTHLSQAHPRRRRARGLRCDSPRYDSPFSRASVSYTARIFASATAVENASARPIATSPSLRRSSSSRPSSRSAWARAVGSSGGTSRPHSPSTITAGIPPTAAPTAGIPSAIASTSARPIPSFRDGAARTSAAARYSSTSRMTLVTCRQSATPSSTARLSSAARSGPSPTSRRRADGTPSRRRGSASTSRSNPLTGTKRPSPTTTYARGGIPRRARATCRGGALARNCWVGTPLGTVTNCERRPIRRARCSSVPG